MYGKQIAAIIKEQIRCGVPLPIIWSWGATGYKSVETNQLELTDNLGTKYPPYLGGLLFKVSGRIHTGHVFIALDPSDTYTIYLGKLSKSEFLVSQKHEYVYCEDLGSTIDELVERQSHYKF